MCVLEIEPHLPDRDDTSVGRKRSQRIDVRRRRFGGVVPDGSENLGVVLSELQRPQAVVEVDADRDDSRDAGGGRLLYHLVGITELLEVAMRVYEDAGSSSSSAAFAGVTSSSLLKSALGGFRARPASSVDGCQRSTLS